MDRIWVIQEQRSNIKPEENLGQLNEEDVFYIQQSYYNFFNSNILTSAKQLLLNYNFPKSLNLRRKVFKKQAMQLSGPDAATWLQREGWLGGDPGRCHLGQEAQARQAQSHKAALKMLHSSV